MKKSFPTLIFLAALVALGLAGWENFRLRQNVAELRGEIAQLEQQRRDLQRQVTSTERGPKPEEKDGRTASRLSKRPANCAV